PVFVRSAVRSLHGLPSFPTRRSSDLFLVVGDDFRFGKGREGDFAMLQQAGIVLGFEVVDTQSYRQHQERVSSTATRRALAAGDLDRKSTRLNSSHVKISYAVFCLKKK